MQSYYIKPKSFYDSLGDVQPSQPYSYAYGDRPVFEFVFLPNEIAEGDTLVFAVDNDMVFYDNAPENLLHSASCMVVVRHYVTAEEATQGKVQLRIETRTLKFRDVTNGKVRPVEVISGLYRRRGEGDDVSYVLLARGRAFANGIIADYDALPEPITTDEYYTKGDIDGLLGEKANESALVAHTDNADIHVTLQDKTTWDSKADVTDIGNATVTITQGGETRGSFSVNATDSVTIDLTGGAQADWNETDTTSPAYIQHKPSVYTKTETDGMLNEKADKASVYTKGETDGMLEAKANVATTLSGYGIQDAYTKGETDGMLDGKADKATTLAGYGIADAYTKSEVDAKVTSVYRYKGTVSAYADLPSSGQEVGDVWNIETADSTHGIKAGDNVAWNGSVWDALSGTVDLTPYATKGELSAGLEGKSDIDHLHTGKYVPLEANNSIPGSYFLRGGLSTGGHISSNGFVNAHLGFKKNNVDLDDIYAAKSHTHAMGDITGLPASGGTAGQVLTKTDTGSEWADAPAGGATTDVANALDDLNKMLESYVGVLDDKDFFHVTALEDTGIKFNGLTNSDYNYEYSYDRRKWYQFVDSNVPVEVKSGCKLWIRNRAETTKFCQYNIPVLTSTGRFTVGGKALSLASKSIDDTIQITLTNYQCSLFYNVNTLVGIEDGFMLPEGIINLKYFFSGCTSLEYIPDTFDLPSNLQYIEDFFYGCSSLASLPDGFTIPSSVTSMNYCFRNCKNMKTIGNNVNINPSTTDEGSFNRNNITSIGTGLNYKSAYTTSYASAQTVFPNATIGAGYHIYQFTDEK